MLVLINCSCKTVALHWIWNVYIGGHVCAAAVSAVSADNTFLGAVGWVDWGWMLLLLALTETPPHTALLEIAFLMAL